MGVFEMVVIIVFIGTAGKVARSAFARRVDGQSESTKNALQALEDELRANELRLTNAEARVEDLGEKLRFVENLLAAPDRHATLPSPPVSMPGGAGAGRTEEPSPGRNPSV